MDIVYQQLLKGPFLPLSAGHIIQWHGKDVRVPLKPRHRSTPVEGSLYHHSDLVSGEDEKSESVGWLSSLDLLLVTSTGVVSE